MNSAQESNAHLPTHYADPEIQPESEEIEVKESLLGRALEACKTVAQFARLLVGLMLDPRVDKKVKVFVAAVLAYIISPADFIPEMLTGIFGMLDDFVLSAFALNLILNWVDPEIVKSHWHGKQDLLATIQRIMRNAEVFVPDGVLKKIQNWVGGHSEKALHSSADA